MLEIIEDILNDIKKCGSCETINDYKKFPCISHGKVDSEYMLVSEAPGKNSVEGGKYWIGAGGKLLRILLDEANKALEENKINHELEDIFYLTDIVKCWPNQNKKNRKPIDAEIINCSPFLTREIEALNPKLILSFGVPSSEYLLDRKITMRDSHGKIYTYNEFAKVLVMYHPSGIDRHMKRNVYNGQLKKVFAMIMDDEIDEIGEIFTKSNNRSRLKLPNKNWHDADIRSKISIPSERLTFVLPASGNRITRNDILKNKLRVTVDFKKYFPNANCVLQFIHNGIVYDVKFTYRDGKSHILKLGSRLMKVLNLNPGSSVNIIKINSLKFVIGKIN